MKSTALTVGIMQTNCYLVASHSGNAAIIDPGAQPEKIIRSLQKEGLTPKLILLTHGHFDHIGAVAALKEQFGLSVYMHEDDEELLGSAEKNGSGIFSLECAFTSCEHPLRDGERISLDELAFTLIHTPGHTKGSCCFQVGDALFTGDTLFCGGIGRHDLYGGSYPTLIQSVKKLAALEGDFNVYPGHEESSTLEIERRTNPYLGHMNYDDIF